MSADAALAAVPHGAGAILTIDLDAVARNWRALAARVAPAECAAVVKADAYGLGIGGVAPALWDAGCRRFYVAHLDEGIALRRILPDAGIAVLNGLTPGTAGEHVAHRLVPVLNDRAQVAEWQSRCASGTSLPGPAQLHVDTGMNRLGLGAGELETLLEDPTALAGLGLQAIISHLACSDEADHPMNPAQLARFRAALARLPSAPASLAASSGIFLGRDYHFDLVRPGAALWGVNPLPGHLNEMSQVVALKGRILQVRDVDRGETVGYGAAHLRDRPGRIATVAVGYADGWLRSLGGKGTAVVAGRHLPIVGRISMDLITLDVTGIDAHLARPGGFVSLIGDGADDVDGVAARGGTIGYELLTLLGRRYHRVYAGSGRPS